MVHGMLFVQPGGSVPEIQRVGPAQRQISPARFLDSKLSLLKLQRCSVSVYRRRRRKTKQSDHLYGYGNARSSMCVSICDISCQRSFGPPPGARIPDCGIPLSLRLVTLQSVSASPDRGIPLFLRRRMHVCTRDKRQRSGQRVFVRRLHSARSALSTAKHRVVVSRIIMLLHVIRACRGSTAAAARRSPLYSINCCSGPASVRCNS